MRYIIFIFIFFVVVSLTKIEANQRLSFPLVYRWSKRIKDSEGCIDPTEPFQCPGTNVCISLQFVCDEHPNDCPDNYDEDSSVCVALKRPPKDSIRRFLSAQFQNSGSKYIEYLFGSKAAGLFSRLPYIKAIDLISISLAVSQNIDEFSQLLIMTEQEKQRLVFVLESVSTGEVQELPPFITDSISEGLGTLINKLISSNFLNLKNVDK